MKYTVFGKTGLQVSQLALGTGNFGTGWGHGADARESEAIFNAYAEAGGNFIDTADIYQFGQSEEVHHEVTPIDLGLLLGVQVVGVTPSG